MAVVCDCGTEKVHYLYNLKAGKTRSCGCLRRELATTQHTTHGHFVDRAQSPTYASWRAMLARTQDPYNNRWYRYGARGIAVDPRWQNFAAFLEDMGERPEGTTLDRIDNDGNYEPGNCRWADKKTQARRFKNRPQG